MPLSISKKTISANVSWVNQHALLDEDNLTTNANKLVAIDGTGNLEATDGTYAPDTIMGTDANTTDNITANNLRITTIKSGQSNLTSISVFDAFVSIPTLTVNTLNNFDFLHQFFVEIRVDSGAGVGNLNRLIVYPLQNLVNDCLVSWQVYRYIPAYGHPDGERDYLADIASGVLTSHTLSVYAIHEEIPDEANNRVEIRLSGDRVQYDWLRIKLFFIRAKISRTAEFVASGGAYTITDTP